VFAAHCCVLMCRPLSLSLSLTLTLSHLSASLLAQCSLGDESGFAFTFKPDPSDEASDSGFVYYTQWKTFNWHPMLMTFSYCTMLGLGMFLCLKKKKEPSRSRSRMLQSLSHTRSSLFVFPILPIHHSLSLSLSLVTYHVTMCSRYGHHFVAAISFKRLPFSHNVNKYIHFGLQTIAVVCSSIAIAVVYKLVFSFCVCISVHKFSLASSFFFFSRTCIRNQ
jgi:hypothetical protein